MDNTLFGVPLAVLGFICLGIALTYYFIWPQPNPQDPPRPAGRGFVLRWGHMLVWLLLAGACFAAGRGIGAFAALLGVAGLLLYIAFLAAIFQDRKIAAK
ncbi:MAG: hypothetical protein KDD92_13555 [Caldilineaceae bacterium]|nr:hypothetical protein [Caldilineaceae bacterium]